MKFYTKPSVELVGKQVVEIEGIFKFLNDHEVEWPEFQKKLNSDMDLGDHDGEWLIELGGRTCYMSWPKTGGEAKGRSHEDHIKHIIEVGHGSCLEHIVLSFQVWGVSRSLLAELTRHRVGISPSVLSQRYVGGDQVSFCIPPDIAKLQEANPELFKKWSDFCEGSKNFYDELVEGLAPLYSDVDDKTEKRKKARQAARSVLPNATETRMLLTINGRTIRHICEMRAHPAADLEIRMFAVELFKVVEKNFPVLVHGMSLVTLPDGTFGVESKFRKV